jgi:hypothetical protein
MLYDLTSEQFLKFISSVSSEIKRSIAMSLYKHIAVFYNNNDKLLYKPEGNILFL